MSSFCHGNHFQIGDILGCEAQSCEVGVGELGESLLVEGSFEILESECAG